MTLQSSLTRRKVMRTCGISVAGIGLRDITGTVSSTESGSTLTIDDQESHGETITIAELTVEQDARLVVRKRTFGEGRKDIFSTELDAGTRETEIPFSLDRPLQESSYVSALIEVDGQQVTKKFAMVAVNETLDDLDFDSLLGDRYEHVEPDEEAGFRNHYSLFIPESPSDIDRPLLVRGLNFGPSETLARHIRALHFRTRSTGQLFRELGYPVLVAGVPASPIDPTIALSMSIHTLQPDERLENVATDVFPTKTLKRADKQTIAMIDDAQKRLTEAGFPISEKVHMHGFSGGATFSDRVSFLHPDRVDAYSAGGDGAYVLPKEELDGKKLPYPIGTANYEEITGRTFDKNTWAEIDRFFFLGEEDQETSWGITSPHSGNQELAEEVFGVNRVTERFPFTEKIFSESGADAEFRLYKGVGHRTTSEMRRDFIAFHRRALPLQINGADIDQLAIGEEVPVEVTVTEQTGVSAKNVSVTVETDIPNQESPYEETVEFDTLRAESRTIVFGDRDDTAELGPFEDEGEHTVTITADATNAEASEVNKTFSVARNTDETVTKELSDRSESVETTGESGPGFGVGGSLAGIGGAAYMLRKGIFRTDD